MIYEEFENLVNNSIGIIGDDACVCFEANTF